MTTAAKGLVVAVSDVLVHECSSRRNILGRIRSAFHKNPRLEWLIPLGFCSFLLAKLLLANRQLSQIADETTHLCSGYLSDAAIGVCAELAGCPR